MGTPSCSSLVPEMRCETVPAETRYTNKTVEFPTTTISPSGLGARRGHRNTTPSQRAKPEQENRFVSRLQNFSGAFKSAIFGTLGCRFVKLDLAASRHFEGHYFATPVPFPEIFVCHVEIPLPLCGIPSVLLAHLPQKNGGVAALGVPLRS